MNNSYSFLKPFRLKILIKYTKAAAPATVELPPQGEDAQTVLKVVDPARRPFLNPLAVPF